MASIRTLEPDVSATIAAGEVVERPASVVKELVENALDAGATKVTIDLADGGKGSIRIDDNASGIPAAELPLAMENFSTSKIGGIDDLARVETLGFRGEALASIRAVSACTVRSRSRDEEIGRELRFRGQEAAGDAPFVRNPGTEVVVERLFFNLPARRKFLRSGPSELRRIIGVVQAYALAFPGTAFVLRDGGRDVLSYPSSPLDDRIEIVLGRELRGSLVPIDIEGVGMRIAGYASRPDFTRSNRYLQFFFVNRRFVKDRLISYAVNQAYESLIPRDRFPAVVLYLTVAPGGVDVNVHPAKSEIRFRDESEVHRIVRTGIRASLAGGRPALAEAVEAAYGGILPDASGAAARPPDVSRAGASAESGPPAEGSSRFEGTMGPLIREAPLSLFGEHKSRIPVGQGALYWQLHQSFILIQIRGGMVIIDQHAAHERILFDRARAALAGSRPLVQSLLFPAAIELTPDEFERYEAVAGVLGSLGFETEPFGSRSIIVRGIPAGVRNWNDGRLLQEILGEGRSGMDSLLKSYACRAAIKAGAKLSAEEMESLADQLFATELPYTCPHGRPTMLRVGLGELERRFARSASAEHE